MATLRQLVRTAVVATLVLAVAVTVGLGPSIPVACRPLSPPKAAFWDLPACGYDLLALQKEIHDDNN